MRINIILKHMYFMSHIADEFNQANLDLANDLSSCMSKFRDAIESGGLQGAAKALREYMLCIRTSTGAFFTKYDTIVFKNFQIEPL